MLGASYLKEPELWFSRLRFFFCRLGDRIEIGEG